MTADRPVVVVGAGVAGLTAARSLVASGTPVVVVDKGRSVGGRLATRRIGSATLDHGAQFFTVRGEAFAATTEDATRDGVVYEWCRGFAEAADGYPRYVVRGGMNRLARWMAAELDCRVDLRVEAIAPHAGGWQVRHEGGQLEASAVIATPPVPQAINLLDAGGAQLPTELADRLARRRYHPTLAVLAVLDGPSGVPPPGGVQLSDGAFSFVGDNHAKGVSDVSAVTLHANHELSTEHYDDSDGELLDMLLGEGRGWLGGAGIVEAQLKRWRYATPIDADPEPTLWCEVGGAPIAFCGDAFAGPKVEGAFRSGLAGAAAVASRV